MIMIIAALIAAAVIAAILSVGIYGWPGDLPYAEKQARKYDRRALRLEREADHLALKGQLTRADNIRGTAADSRDLAAALRTPPRDRRETTNPGQGESIRLTTRKT